MKQIIFPLTILEFTWLFTDGFMEENSLVLLYQRNISSSQYRTSTRNFPQFLATRYENKIFAPQKNICALGGGVNTIENKNTKTAQ